MLSQRQQPANTWQPDRNASCFLCSLLRVYLGAYALEKGEDRSFTAQIFLKCTGRHCTGGTAATAATAADRARGGTCGEAMGHAGVWGSLMVQML